jgi:hypothetical protein
VQAGADNLIGTVWGRGYMVRDPSSEPQSLAFPFGPGDVCVVTETAAQSEPG